MSPPPSGVNRGEPRKRYYRPCASKPSRRRPPGPRPARLSPEFPSTQRRPPIHLTSRLGLHSFPDTLVSVQRRPLLRAVLATRLLHQSSESRLRAVAESPRDLQPFLSPWLVRFPQLD